MALLIKILPFIKSYYKQLAFVGLVILVIVLWLRGEHEKNRADEAEQGRDAAIQISNGIKSSKYKNKQGDTVLVTQVIGLPKSQVDELLKARDLQWLKKLEGIKKDNLQEAETFRTRFELTSAPEIKYLPCKDSVKTSEFDIHDQWNDIHAVVVGTPKIEIRDRYFGAIELRRPKHWFWKLQWSRREAISEITNSNKRIKIDSVIVITIKR